MSQHFPDASGAFVDPADGTVDWRGLEQAAFAEHPEVQQAIAEGVAEASQAPPRFDFALAAVRFLIELGPLLAFGVVYIGSRGGGNTGIAMAIAAAIGLVFIVQQLVLWRQMSRDIREVDGRRIVLAWVNALLSLLTAFWMWVSSGHTALWYPAAAVMAAAAVVAVVTAVRMRRIGKAHTMGDAESAMKLASATGRSRAAVAAMDEADRLAVKVRIDAAVRRLQETGAIDPHVAEEAIRQPLGSLGRWEIAARMRAEMRTDNRDRGRG